MSKRWIMWGACGVMVLGGGYLLWAKGSENILGYGMLLLCPLMHLLLHRGQNHGGHSEHPSQDSQGGAEAEKGASCH